MGSTASIKSSSSSSDRTRNKTAQIHHSPTRKQQQQIQRETDPTMTGHYRRRAHHAGSWYPDDALSLSRTLQQYLTDALKDNNRNSNNNNIPTGTTKRRRLRGLICPHAGYSYSGPTAAHSYQALLSELGRLRHERSEQQQSRPPHITAPIVFPTVKILVLHPCHHATDVSLRGRCGVSNASVLETPLPGEHGQLTVDDDLRREILALSADRFVLLVSQSDDEHEHSGEMQYPFLAHCIQQVNAAASADSRVEKDTGVATTTTTTNNNPSTGSILNVTVTPVMCGSLSMQDEMAIGTLLAEIVARPDVLTIVSTDFCHWGRRFHYQPTTTTSLAPVPTTNERNPKSESTPLGSRSRTALPIHEIIRTLDRRGMDEIEAQRPGAFAAYLQQTNNTICGRHAVAVWLRAIEAGRSLQEPTYATAIHNNNNDENASETSSTCTSLSIQFIYYAQSSPATCMSDSSVSYAAAVATVDETHVRA